MQRSNRKRTLRNRKETLSSWSNKKTSSRLVARQLFSPTPIVMRLLSSWRIWEWEVHCHPLRKRPATKIRYSRLLLNRPSTRMSMKVLAPLQKWLRIRINLQRNLSINLRRPKLGWGLLSTTPLLALRRKAIGRARLEPPTVQPVRLLALTLLPLQARFRIQSIRLKRHKKWSQLPNNRPRNRKVLRSQMLQMKHQPHQVTILTIQFQPVHPTPPEMPQAINPRLLRWSTRCSLNRSQSQLPWNQWTTLNFRDSSENIPARLSRVMPLRIRSPLKKHQQAQPRRECPRDSRRKLHRISKMRRKLRT